METAYQTIKNFKAGEPLRVRRQIDHSIPCQVNQSVLRIWDDDQILLEKQIEPLQISSLSPESLPTSGHIRRLFNPSATQINFDLSEDETNLLRPPKKYNYEISVESNHPHNPSRILERGIFTSGSPSPSPAIPGDATYNQTTSYTTYADACQTVTGRTALIIDGFLDAILGNYRQLKVWDEHARRSVNDPTQFHLTYEYINHYTVPEIYNGQNQIIDPGNVTFDYRNGQFSVSGDDGNQDYFVTYTFNFFPEQVLRMFVIQSLYELNFVGVGQGAGYVTHFTAIEQTPHEWDGLIALGAAAKAWKRLSTDISIWRNWLIFSGDMGEGVQAPSGATAQAAATEASQYYQTMFNDYGAATKFDKFLALPTQYFLMFLNTGFGNFGSSFVQNQVVDGKYRGFTINKAGGYAGW